MTMARRSALSSKTCTALAGLRAFEMNSRSSEDHSTTSIFSPPSSLTMFCMRTPRMPTHEPTGSTPLCSATTAILER